jgi:hypothetical protein
VLARRRFFFICTSFYPASATDDTTWQLFLLHFQSFFLKFTTDFTSFVGLSTSAVSRFLFYFDFDFLHWGTQCRSLVQLNPLPFFLKKKQTTEIRDFFSRRRMVTGEFRTGHRAFRSGNPVAAELKRSLKNVTCCWRMAAAREGPRPAGGSLLLLEIGPEGWTPTQQPPEFSPSLRLLPQGHYFYLREERKR